jgi:hypothetical protein
MYLNIGLDLGSKLITPMTTSSVAWNGSDKAAEITLTNGGLTATNNRVSFNGTHYAVRATSGKSTGKWVFRARFTDFESSSDVSIGLANATHSLSTYIGAAGSNSVGFRASGLVHLNGASLGTMEAAVVGEYTDIAADLDNDKLWVRIVGGSNNWNDGVGEDPATNTGGVSIAALTGTVYPACSLFLGAHDGGPNICDYVQSIPASDVPSGFTFWL